jgi:membrane-associated protease RseP (regulator of RpoE activity)
VTALLYLIGVVAFLLAILVSIALHELGHLIPAKAFGGKVTQYFVGFGRTVWSRRLGETEVGIKSIPLGGYVKIVGMLPPAADGPAGTVRQSNTGMFTQLISDARSAEWETIRPEDEPRLFYRFAWWKKVIVMGGGPTVNLLIAFGCFLAIFGLYGVRNDVPDAGAPRIEAVSVCVLPYDESGRDCTASDPQAPAYAAGLRPGDVITSFNGTAITGYDQLRDLIRANAAGTATIAFDRVVDGTAQHRTVTTSTTVQARPSGDDTDPDAKLTQVGFLGITPYTHTEVDHEGPLYTLQQMGDMTKTSLGALVHLPVRVWGVAEAIAHVKPRSADSPVSIVGGGRLAGETISEHGFPLVDKLMFLLSLVASFNLFIGLFNFIPLLPLDGGHIASALWEAVRRGFARVVRRPDPGYVDAAKLLPVAYVVATCLLVMGVVLIVGDLVVPVHLPAN